MVECKISCDKNLEKKFEAGKFHRIEFKGMLTFTNLTLADRKIIGLNTEEMTDKDTTETIVWNECIPPLTDDEQIKATIIKRLEHRKKNYMDNLKEVKSEAIEVEGNGVFT